LKKYWRKRLRQGSFTVEAAVLLPFLILLVFVFLCLCLYLHDRSVLVSCAAELAGKGAAKKYHTEGELEEWLRGQAQELIENRLLATRECKVSVEVTQKKITIEYVGQIPLLGGLEIREQETAKRLNPVVFIRSSKQWIQRLRK